MNPPSSSSNVSGSLLRQMIEQNDQKHEAGHRRLRHDLTEGFNDMHTTLSVLQKSQATDHDRITTFASTKERRHELSGYKAVIIAAIIGGGFRLVEVVITQAAAVLGRHP